jgi:hypothetical protein
MGIDGATYTNTTGIFATWLLQRIQYCSKMLQDVTLLKLVCNYYAPATPAAPTALKPRATNVP